MARLMSCCIILWLYHHGLVSALAPPGCVEYDTDGVYSCDFREITLPFPQDAFSSPPQHLTLTAVKGFISGNTFTNLSSSSANFPISGKANQLNIVCSGSANLTLSQDAFFGLDWVDVLTFTDCQIKRLPSSVFAPFGNLDRLEFNGGSIYKVQAEALAGLTVAKNTSLLISHGHLKFDNTEFKERAIPSGFLTPIRGLVSHISIVGGNIRSLDADTFQSCSSLVSLDLSRNPLNSVHQEFLSQPDVLAKVNLHRIPIDCSSCDSLLFLQHGLSRRIEMSGALVCDSPANFKDTRAKAYFYDNCATQGAPANQSIAGLQIGGNHWSYQELGLVIAAVVVFAMCLIDLVCVCKLDERMAQSANRPRHSGQGKLKNAVRKIANIRKVVNAWH